MQSDENNFCRDVVLDSFTWHIVMKTAFKTNNMKGESFGNVIMKILDFMSD